MYTYLLLIPYLPYNKAMNTTSSDHFYHHNKLYLPFGKKTVRTYYDIRMLLHDVNIPRFQLILTIWKGYSYYIFRFFFPTHKVQHLTITSWYKYTTVFASTYHLKRKFWLYGKTFFPTIYVTSYHSIWKYLPYMCKKLLA